jgi:hypothetical protein
MKVTDIVQHADILGAILFGVLFSYFYNLKKRTTFENILLFSTGVALIVDSYFVYLLLTTSTSTKDLKK